MKKRLNPLLWAICLLIFYCSTAFSQSKVEQWTRFETAYQYAAKGNSFVDVNLSATFKGKDTTYSVTGFYDGNNTFKIRFMPEKIGIWTYTTQSNIPELNNKKGSFECVKATADNHGIVRVNDVYNFKYADGKQYYPVGTTAYAWNHMRKDVQELTLKSLENSGFNKLRMCVFPKDYNLVKEEPEIYPFLSKSMENGRKSWDLTTFNPAFFSRTRKAN